MLKPPVWTPEIPLYFFTGGLAGASAGLALARRGCAGNDELARRAWLNAAVAVGVSPALLISDLGRPERFLNMLRVFKVTSPMSVGSWVLAGSGLTTTVARRRRVDRRACPRRSARPARGRCRRALGLPLATYTAALLANTAVPVWHEARRDAAVRVRRRRRGERGRRGAPDDAARGGRAGAAPRRRRRGGGGRGDRGHGPQARAARGAVRVGRRGAAEARGARR